MFKVIWGLVKFLFVIYAVCNILFVDYPAIRATPTVAQLSPKLLLDTIGCFAIVILVCGMTPREVVIVKQKYRNKED